ncbi:MAG: hypothetical protein KJ928_04305 [Candidatus Altiarchaeota archaeon]|nr:hypothetical protein [Candidatus Altiarchaeota archaeon]MBU4437393.1 hypothetical protein [Candidatus Altiarchaeota archaeon]
MNSRLLTGLCILLLVASGATSTGVTITYRSRIDYQVTPRKYVNKDKEVTITVMVMGKTIAETEWKPVIGTVKVESEPTNSDIPPTIPSKGTITFTPVGDTLITLTYDGDDTHEGSREEILIGVLHFSSPLVSSQFIMLFIILIIVLFSYRLFTRGKLDVKSLWGEIRGE